VKEKLAFAFAAVSTAVTVYLVPSWRGFGTDPCLWASVAAVVTILVLLVTRHLGDHASLFEVRWLALFLSGMPVIYLGRWILSPRHAAGYTWLFVELGGVLLYVTLAVLGLRRHWLLAAGIAAHGIIWDSWHYSPGSSYIPSWYAIGCLIVDVGLATYAATRIPVWRRAEERIGDAKRALSRTQVSSQVSPSPITAK
jgi:hypothetical protein